jgi:hypothetical protein
LQVNMVASVSSAAPLHSESESTSQHGTIIGPSLRV